ncbi:hypothetical protein [Halopiger djelfimassiliensis]|uniref:hypothetical protein n=1 Tax=Halopiger djelfimassiliensis TaxID=1293047 RepID=UPI0006776054|nr:hypothetical protein [Halopiger djelfimassiliensis]
MEFAVSRDGAALVTLQGGSETTACDDARRSLAATLESLSTDGTIDGWEIDDADVYEHPTAPFDPYTITIEFTVTVVVDADGDDRAAEVGANAIDDALDAAGVDAVSYTSAPTTAPA